MPAELRRVTAADWPDLRRLRLEALGDSPTAFCGVCSTSWSSRWRWGAAQGARRLRLLVHESIERAAAAYARLGFFPTGHREPYPLQPATEEVEMARPLR